MPKARTRKKTQADISQYQAAAIATIDGYGAKGAMLRPFDHDKAVQQFKSWVYAAARINAEAVASVPLRLYVKKRAGKKCLFQTKAVSHARRDYLTGEGKHTPHNGTMRKLLEFGEFEEVTDEHPLPMLLERVNPYLNGFDLATLRILWQELTGNAYLLKVHGDGQAAPPTELWPLPPQWVWVKPGKANWLDGYIFSRNGVVEKTFAPDEVIHFKRANPGGINPRSAACLYYGMGWVEAAWSAVQINEANHTMDQALSENSARPDYLVIVKSGGEQATLDRLGVDFARRLRGPRKNGAFLTLPGDVDVKPLNFPPKDLAGRDNVVNEIAALSGVPVSMLLANDPNLASAKAGYAQWRESSILPRCRQDEQQLNQDLVPLFSPDLCVAYDNPVPKDEQFEVTRSQVFVSSGVQTPNEARMTHGLEPHEDPMADKLLVNGTPLGGAVPMAGPGIGPAVEGDPAKPVEPADAPAGELEKPGAAQEIQTTEATVLNGAQISSAKDIVLAVVAGDLPRDSGVAMLQTFFNLAPEVAEAIMGSAGMADVPTTPNPNPKAEAEAEAQRELQSSGAGAGVGADSAGAGGSGDPAGGDDKKRNERDTSTPAKAVDGGAVPGVVLQPTISHKALANGACALDCECHAEPVTLEKAWGTYSAKVVEVAPVDGFRTYAKADASDTAREGEPENPLLTFARQMDAIFADQREAVAARLERGAKAAKDDAAITAALLEELAAFNERIDSAVKPFVTRMARVGGNVGLDLVRQRKPDFVGVFDVTNPAVDEFLSSYTVELRTQIQGYTGDAISSTVKDALADGSTTAEIARDLRSDATAAGGSLSPARSETIARTESARAYVEGERKAWSDSGVVQGKQWLLAPDACDFCKEVAAQFESKNVGVNDPFLRKGSTITAGGKTMVLDYSDVQGPPLHPNDRCDLIPVIKED